MTPRIPFEGVKLPSNSEPRGWVFLILADWNVKPSEVNHNWLDELRAKIWEARDVVFKCRSGKGRVLDFVVASRTMEAIIKGVDAVHVVTWGPHIGIQVTVAAKPRNILHPVLGKRENAGV